MKCAFCERCPGGVGRTAEEASLKTRQVGALALALALAACEGGFQVKLPSPTAGPAAAATAVSPVTSVAAPAAGLAFAGAAYTYACSVASAPATLYPAVYLSGASSWQVYQGLPCVLDPAVAPRGTCSFPASSSVLGAVWNAYKTGSGSLSGCVATPDSAAYPARVSTGGGGGTVTSVAMSMPPEFQVSGSPVTSSGTLAASWAAAAGGTVLARAPGVSGAPSFQAITTAFLPTGTGPGQVLTGGVVAAGTCQACEITYNDAGQVVAGRSLSLFWDPVNQDRKSVV